MGHDSLYILVSKLLIATDFLLNRNYPVWITGLVWRMYGTKKPANSGELIFFSYQKMLWPPHIQLVYLSLMGKKKERDLEMMGCRTQRYPARIHSMEEDGPIFYLLLMSCEYQCLIFSKRDISSKVNSSYIEFNNLSYKTNNSMQHLFHFHFSLFLLSLNLLGTFIYLLGFIKVCMHQS